MRACVVLTFKVILQLGHAATGYAGFAGCGGWLGSSYGCGVDGEHRVVLCLGESRFAS